MDALPFDASQPRDVRMWREGLSLFKRHWREILALCLKIWALLALVEIAEFYLRITGGYGTYFGLGAAAFIFIVFFLKREPFMGGDSDVSRLRKRWLPVLLKIVQVNFVPLAIFVAGCALAVYCAHARMKMMMAHPELLTGNGAGPGNMPFLLLNGGQLVSDFATAGALKYFFFRTFQVGIFEACGRVVSVKAVRAFNRGSFWRVTGNYLVMWLIVRLPAVILGAAALEGGEYVKGALALNGAVATYWTFVGLFVAQSFRIVSLAGLCAFAYAAIGVLYREKQNLLTTEA